MNSMPLHHTNVQSKGFVIDGWPVHVMKGQTRLLDDLHYVSFTGDFGFRHGYPLPSREVVEEFIRNEKRLLSHFDVNIVNLEFILPGTGGNFRQRKQAFDAFNKRRTGAAVEETANGMRLHWLYLLLETLMLDVLKQTGFHAVTLANNHVNDYGPDGILYNQERLTEAGLSYFGTRDRPYFPISLNDVTGTVYGMTDLVDTDLLDPTLFRKTDTERLVMKLNRDTLHLIKREVANQDFSIAFVQLISPSLYPSSYELEQVDALVDTGFDLVVCTGSHWIRGISFRKGVPVIFGTGNYLFSYTDEFCEPVGMHVVAGFRHGKVEQLFAIPFHNSVVRGNIGPLGTNEYLMFCDALADRSSFNDKKYFHDSRTLSELKKSIRSYGFLPTKVSMSAIWMIDNTARLYLYHMFRTILCHLPTILRNAGRQMLATAKLFLSTPLLLAGGAVYALFRSIPFLRNKFL